MAIFNPQISPTDPRGYLSLSKTVDIPPYIQPEGVKTNQIMPRGVLESDKSGQYAYQGIGEAVSGSLGLLDMSGKIGVDIIKDSLKQKIYAGVDEIRDQYTQDLRNKLQDITNPPSTQGPSLAIHPEGPNTPPLNILDTSEKPPLPGALESLPQSIAALEGARASGKISETYYEGRLLSLAKSQRTQHPGFKDYIDSEFHKATGMIPANAIVKSLAGDINSYVTNQQAEHNKILGEVREEARKGNTVAPLVYAKFQKDNDINFVNQWIAQENADSYQIKKAKDKLEFASLTRKAAQDEAMDVSTLIVQKNVQDVWNKTSILMNLRFGLDSTSPAQMQELMRKQASGELKTLNDDVWKEAAQSVRAFKLEGYQRSLLDLNAPDSTGRTLSTHLGGASKVRSDVLDPSFHMFDMLEDAITRKDIGLMYTIKNRIEANKDAHIAARLEDPVMAKFVYDMNFFKEFGGPTFLTDFTANHLIKNYGKLKDVVNNDKMSLVTQPGLLKLGDKTNLKDILDRYQKMPSQTTPLRDPNVAPDLLKVPLEILNPTLPKDAKGDVIRSNIIQGTFSPENWGLISKAEADSVDTQGRPRPGRYALYSNYTSERMAGEVWDTSKRTGNVKMWTDYVKWTEHSFGKELFERDLINLSRVPAAMLGWDDKGLQFKLPPNVAPYSFEGRTINRLNEGLKGLNNVYRQQEGADSNTAVYNLIKAIGFEGDENTKRLTGDILKAMVNTKIKDLGTGVEKAVPMFNPLQQGNTRSQFQQEGRVPPSELADWLANPITQIDIPAPPRAEVTPSKRWWGDKEGQAAGIYETPTKSKKKQ